MDNLRVIKQEVSRIINDCKNGIEWNSEVIERWSKEGRNIDSPKQELQIYIDLFKAINKVKTKHNL